MANAGSWATDAHKCLNVPFDCGLAFVRDAESHQRAVQLQYVDASSWIDYLQFAKSNGRWVIINVLWELRNYPRAPAMAKIGRMGAS